MNAHAAVDAPTDELLFTTDEAGLARIVLNRPQARNALPFAMYRGLVTCCERIAQDPERSHGGHAHDPAEAGLDREEVDALFGEYRRRYGV